MNNTNKTLPYMIYIFAIFAIFAFSMILLAHDAYAYPSGHIGLLTVSEISNNTEYGGVADLYLEVRPGTGRIFMDSFPLSKIDTQITMRFAAEVACDLLERDCSNYDFFYTIRANSAVVGGPSAGAAATVLAVAVLDDAPLDNGTIMTGTINSGNLIGPVSGIPAKSVAAQAAGYKRVLIPKWGLANNTPSENLSIDVVKVSTLEEALYYFTGKNYSANGKMSPADAADYSREYRQIMGEITVDLCTRYGSISNGTIILPNLTAYGVNVTNISDNFALALSALNNNSFYSAASFCFGGNVKIHDRLISNLSNEALKLQYAMLMGNVSAFEEALQKDEKSLSTISQLEAYMIVAQRLSDATKALRSMDMNNISSYQLAYASERYYTAVEWSKFSRLSGQKFIMDPEFLKSACTRKLSEAEERLNYLEIYYPSGDLRNELADAYDYYSSGDYALCIFASSKVKADSDVVLSAIFVPDKETPDLLNEKLAAANSAIARQEESDVFPILGYSYYEYSNTLKDTDTYSALLYAEYSLELSNLDMYFKKKEALNLPSGLMNSKNFYVFLLGFSIGVLISMVILMLIVKFSRKDKKNLRLRKGLSNGKR